MLVPAYDTLPVRYAPVGGELVPRNFAERPLQPTAATLPEWARVSSGFRQIAAKNLRHIGL